MLFLLKYCVGLIPVAYFERASAYSIHRSFFRGISRTARFNDRESLWTRSLERFTNRKLIVLEFGVFQGGSMRILASLNKHPDSEFYGFDSFEGLPEAWDNGLAKGHFSTKGVMPRVEDKRIKFIKGWFQDTVPAFLDEKRDLFDKSKNNNDVFVHFDADLYSSTLYLLATLHGRIPEYSFVFDEFTGHESRACYNYIKACNPEYDFTGHTLQKGYPWQVAGIFRERSRGG
jgi:hypothetical protein